MRILRLTLLFCLLISFSIQAQTEYRNREFSFTNENDVYLMLSIDRYYSNGLFLNYRFSPEQAPPSDLRVKKIYDLAIAQRFWTPQDVRLRRIQDYWRPYAGMLHFAYRQSNFYSQQNRLMFGADIGVIGKASGAEAFQEWYHRAFGFDNPRGWDTQIANVFVIDAKLEYNRQFWLKPQKVDLISSSSLSVGNAFTHAIQRLDLRVGKLRDLRQSAFVNALIGEGSETIQTHSYFVLGYGIEAVGHNTTIEGHVFKEESPYTEEIVPWVRHLRLGFAFSSTTSTLKFTYNWLSREVKEDAGRHAYIALELQLRMLPKGKR